MGKFGKQLLFGVLLLFLGIILGPIIYRLIGDDYPGFIKDLPFWKLGIAFLIVLLIIGAVWIIKRKIAVKKSNLDRQVSDFSIFPTDAEIFGLLNYKGVGWKVQYSKPLSLGSFFPQEDPKKYLLKIKLKEINLDYSAFCPECLTALEERDIFFGLYLWQCEKCEFKKRSIRGLNYERKKATIRAREEFEKIKKGGSSKIFIVFEEYRSLFNKSS